MMLPSNLASDAEAKRHPIRKSMMEENTMFARNLLRMPAVLLLIVAVSLAACAPAATPAPAPTNPPAPQQAQPTTAPAEAQPTTAPAAANPTAEAPMAQAVTLEIAQNDKLGNFLADGDGRTLYLFTKDTPDTSNCYDKCQQAWPPLLTQGQPTLMDGVSSTLISTTVRTDGSIQLTYNGWPLYYYSKDAAAGDTTGQAVNNVWWVVSGEGNPIEPATLAVTQTDKLGTIIVDGSGRTLYLYTKDTKDTTTCYGKCEQAWPPLLTLGNPTLGDGTTASLVGSTQRKDGSMQVTYNGWPLYYYFKDHAAGDTTGRGVNNVWYVVTPDGQAVK
jgi:predicted lipoprotein with Yx(FWY)xxD motif